MINRNKIIEDMNEHLLDKRNMIIALLKMDLNDLEDKEEIFYHFNNELNSCQFVIENIENFNSLESNPYFWKWIEECIEFFKISNQNLYQLFVNFKRLVESGNNLR